MKTKKTISLALVLALGLASISLGQGDPWTTKAPMPTPRMALSTSVVDGIIYAIGGSRDFHQPAYATVEAYDPETDAWTTKAPMPTPRQALSTCVVDGIIYAIGGFADAAMTGLSTVKAYDPKTDTWTEKDDMPTPRAALSTCGVDGIIYAIGGRIYPYGAFSAVEAYDPVTNTWMTKTDMPTARCWLSSSTVDGRIYAIGGLHGGGPVATVEEYDTVGPRLDGAWIVAAPTPLGGKAVHTVFMTAQDADGLRYTVVMAHSECSPSVWGNFPEATKKADMVGMAVKTGPTTSKGTLIGYGVKAGELEEEVVYIQVASYEATLVDENTLELSATQSFYLPEQDADGDGFPDEGQLPVLCTPYTVPCRRVTLVPMCVPESPQE